jgi:hypothetical protein
LLGYRSVSQQVWPSSQPQLVELNVSSCYTYCVLGLFLVADCNTRVVNSPDNVLNYNKHGFRHISRTGAASNDSRRGVEGECGTSGGRGKKSDDGLRIGSFEPYLVSAGASTAAILKSCGTCPEACSSRPGVGYLVWRFGLQEF